MSQTMRAVAPTTAVFLSFPAAISRLAELRIPRIPATARALPYHDPAPRIPPLPAHARLVSRRAAAPSPKA